MEGVELGSDVVEEEVKPLLLVLELLPAVVGFQPGLLQLLTQVSNNSVLLVQL